MEPDDARGQPVWRLDDQTVYGWTIIYNENSAGTLEYAGAGLMLHSRGDAFVATVTVDGWLRAHPTDIVIQYP